MGPLVAVGALHVPGEAVYSLERELSEVCERHGFPPTEEFKWSPSKKHWMRERLVEHERERFFLEAIAVARNRSAKALVVIVDTQHRPATGASDPLADATTMFLERANNRLTARDRYGIVVADRPSGGAAEDARYLAGCLEMLQTGTDYVQPDRIAINVLSTPSHLVRQLQLADVVTSATTAFVGGETVYSPTIVAALRPLFHASWTGIGGVGVKVHPDFNYLNLYHWLFGDTFFARRGMGYDLPLRTRPFADSPDSW